jgi:hypothetical protein
MRKLLIVAAMIYSMSAWGAVEYRRPTADANGTYSGCNGTTDVASSSMSAVYSGKTGVGPTGVSANMPNITTASQYSQRIFSSFAAASQVYSTLIIHVSGSTVATNSASAVVFYSGDSGSTWVDFGNFTSTQSTVSQNITGKSLSNLQVMVCEVTGPTGTTQVLATVNDIWTEGISLPAVVGSVFEDGALYQFVPFWKKWDAAFAGKDDVYA